jgi:hypothetical protein
MGQRQYPAFDLRHDTIYAACNRRKRQAQILRRFGAPAGISFGVAVEPVEDPACSAVERPERVEIPAWKIRRSSE